MWGICVSCAKDGSNCSGNELVYGLCFTLIAVTPRNQKINSIDRRILLKTNVIPRAIQCTLFYMHDMSILEENGMENLNVADHGYKNTRSEAKPRKRKDLHDI